MRAHLPIAAALSTLAALALTACGGSSKPPPLSSRTPDAIVTAAIHAIDGASSVHVTGAVAGRSAQASIRVDLRLLAGRGATGSLSENGLSFRLVTVGDDAYVNGSPAFWRQFGGAAVAARLQGRWLSAPADRGEFSSFSALTDLHRLLSGLLSGHGTLTRGATTTIAGRRAITLHDASRHGTLYVATVGPPYPLRLVTEGAGGGELSFSGFDAPVRLRAPADSVSLESLPG